MPLIMPRRVISIILSGFVICLILVTLVRAADDDCERPSSRKIQSLVNWIAAHSDYDVSQTSAFPPRIHFCSSGDEIPYLGTTNLVEPGDLAFYDFKSRQIFIVEPWFAADPQDVGTLLHELIHDVQFQNRNWECPNAAEWEAHKLHALWLEEQGIDPNFDWFRIYFLARCPRDIHP